MAMQHITDDNLNFTIHTAMQWTLSEGWIERR